MASSLSPNCTGFLRPSPEIDQVAVVDEATLKTLARVGDIKYPDGLAYAPTVQRIFVSDEHGNADVVIDATNNTLVTSIPLGGGAGNTVYDSGADRIYVAVHGKNELVDQDRPATLWNSPHAHRSPGSMIRTESRWMWRTSYGVGSLCRRSQR